MPARLIAYRLEKMGSWRRDRDSLCGLLLNRTLQASRLVPNAVPEYPIDARAC